MTETFSLPRPHWFKDDKYIGTLIIGGQWGDEAKGKIVYTLAEHHDIVIRYNGGPNAGHTLDDVILHQIPSGIQYEDVVNVMAQGQVISPKKFCKELEDLKKVGTYVSPERLKVSPKAHVILPHEVALDLGGVKKLVDTTGKGIGPTYAQKIERFGIRVIDLADRIALKEKLKRSVNSINARLSEDGQVSLYDVEKEAEEYGKVLISYMADVKDVLGEAKDKKKKFLFEGAQGALLDIDNGTYPNVTSSNTTRPSVGQLGYYLLVTKALCGCKGPMSRVGKGPFPPEWGGNDNKEGTRRLIEEEKPLVEIREKIANGKATEEEKILLERRKKELIKKLRPKVVDGSASELEKGAYFAWVGDEFGATTGRARRLGPLDLVLAKYVVDANALDGIILTKWDVYSGTGLIPFVECYEYLAGDEGRHRTYDLTEFEFLNLEDMEPIIRELPGWEEDIQGMTEWDELPQQTKDCVGFVEEVLGIPVEYFSTGPKKHHLAVRKVA